MKFRDKMKKIFSKRKEKIEYIAEFHELEDIHVFSSLMENKTFLEKFLESSEDIIYRSFNIGQTPNRGLLVYIDEMVDQQLLNEEVLKPLMAKGDYYTNDTTIFIDQIKNEVLSVINIKRTSKFSELVLYLLRGNSLLFVEDAEEALVISSFGGELRSVEESIAEQTVRGPREGFTESLQNNITMIRRRICDHNLAVEFFTKGKRTQTNIALIYLKDMVHGEMVEELRDRLRRIKTEKITASAEIEQLIETNKWSLFPQMMATERPDKVAGSLLEGRAAIIVDGTPFILVAPATLAMFFNSPDDYFERVIVTSLMRIIRYICYFVAATLPAIYIALTAYHPGMLPTSFALYVTGTRIGIPFPVLIEMLFMEFTLQALLEAAIRLPKAVGQTIGIVGGLVIGQAAVQAGLVSPIVIIVVALTAITSFVIPNYTFALTNRVLRIPFIIGASLTGLYGIIAIWLAVLIHLASLESFGIRYLSDFSPFRYVKLRDTILKAPKGLMEGKPEAVDLEDLDG